MVLFSCLRARVRCATVFSAWYATNEISAANEVCDQQLLVRIGTRQAGVQLKTCPASSLPNLGMTVVAFIWPDQPRAGSSLLLGLIHRPTEHLRLDRQQLWKSDQRAIQRCHRFGSRRLHNFLKRTAEPQAAYAGSGLQGTE